MIYDKLSRIEQYPFPSESFQSAVQDILQRLHEPAPEGASFGKNRMMFTTVPKPEKRFEAHKKYIDIHIVLEGKENVEVSDVDCLTEQTAYDEEQDYCLGDVRSDCKFQGSLQPGYFLVCFPGDAHLVGAHEQEEQTVTKVVYKIPV